MLKDISEMVGLAVIGILVLVGIAILTALPVMYMWNYLMPSIFGLKEIDFTQALILSALCSTLFKSSPSTSSKK